MSMDLTGEDAFDRVLDRMVEAEKRAATAQEAQNGSRHEISALQQSLSTVRSELATVKTKLQAFENSDDVFIQLYDAIERAAREIDGRESSLETADLLRTKMAAARKFIDPIPF